MSNLIPIAILRGITAPYNGCTVVGCREECLELDITCKFSIAMPFIMAYSLDKVKEVLFILLNRYV